jgi:spore maturation protein CgeB
MPLQSVDSPVGSPRLSTDCDIVIVGNDGGTNVGASFLSAAKQSRECVRFCDARTASAGPRALRAVAWHLGGHRPPRLSRFSADVARVCRTYKPRVLLTTGLAPVSAHDLAEIGALGVRRVNYLTDDPWNPAFSANWFFKALPNYDRVLSVRRANIHDLRSLGCRRVDYLPFAYDDGLFGSDAPATAEQAHFDTVFAGGADRDRIPFIKTLLESGLRVALVGDYWDRFAETRGRGLGHLPPIELREVTRRSKTAICLVRRANRDGHVMRSFEIPAIGTCMLAEDTSEHRDLFGNEGEAVLYFQTPREMIRKLNWVLSNDQKRNRMACSANAAVRGGANTYADRLRTILDCS